MTVSGRSVGVGALLGPTAPATEAHAELPPAGLAGFVFVVGLTAMVLVSFAGTAGPAIFLALWVLLALAYGRACVSCLLWGPRLVWLLPGLAMLSTLWSQAKPETLRFSIEYVATVAFAVLSAWMLRPRTLLVALVFSMLALSVVSLAAGGDTVDPLTGETTFIGVFESKNQLGFFSSLMFLAGIALVADGHQPAPLRLIGIGAALMAVPLMVVTRSATSVTAVTLATLALIFGLMSSRLDRFGRSRMVFFALVLLLATLLLLLLAGADASGAFLRIMGKDTTLTGRTFLWRYAAQIIPDSPLLGRGFQAFWRHDDVNAESIWSFFRIRARSGFSFHNAYIEQAIQLGYVGVALLVMTLVGIGVGLLRWSWHVQSVPAAFFVALMMCMLARSATEVDFLGPFQLGAFILGVLATYAATKPREDRN